MTDNSSNYTNSVNHRLPFLAEDEMTEQQKEMFSQFKKFSLNGTHGPFNMMLRSPEAAERFQALGKYLRFETGIEEKLVELAVLIHARLWNDQYEWYLHAPRAIKAGLAEETVESLRLGKLPSVLAEDENAIFSYVLELESSRKVSDKTLKSSLAVLGDSVITDLVFMLGQYATISMLLAVLQEGADLDVLPSCINPFADYFI